MKKMIVLLLALMVLLPGCASRPPVQIAATTLPVYEFTSRLCQGTGLYTTRLITENVSCLHDYTLRTDQMAAIEQAELVVINGAGLEDFMHDALSGAKCVVDASQSLHLAEGHHHHEGHVHSEDPHIWLSPENAKAMTSNIAAALCEQYPMHAETIRQNEALLIADLNALQNYGSEKLASLSCRKLITFHDGFAYLAESFDLEILRAIEEESGSEASAAELIELIQLVHTNDLSTIFTEINGSASAASIICAETGATIYQLDMAMSGSGYFESMYRNIDTLWEALQ